MSTNRRPKGPGGGQFASSPRAAEASHGQLALGNDISELVSSRLEMERVRGETLQTLKLHRNGQCPDECCPQVIKLYPIPHGHEYPHATPRAIQALRLQDTIDAAEETIAEIRATETAFAMGYNSIGEAVKQMFREVKAVEEGGLTGNSLTPAIRNSLEKWMLLYGDLRRFPAGKQMIANEEMLL